MFTYVLTSILIIILYLWYRKRKAHFTLFQKLGIPGPTPNIFFGNYLQIFLKGAINSQKEWISQYGKLLGYYSGLTPVLLVTDTNLLRKILIKDFQKFIDRPNITNESTNTTAQGLSGNLLILKGSKWKEMRSVVTPSFTTSKMKMMSPIMNDAIDTLLENFEKFCQNGQVFEAYELFQKLTLDVIIRTAFGIQTNLQKNPKDPIYKLAYILFHPPFRFFFILMTRSFHFFQPVFRLFRIVSAFVVNRGVNPLTDLLDRCKAIVNSRKTDQTKKRLDLLQLLIDSKIKENINIDYQTLAAGDNMMKEDVTDTKNGEFVNTRHLTIDEMTANSLVFLLAGYETTSTALAFSTLMLANFPEEQEKIRKEINELIEEGNQLDYDSVHKLQYLDQVFKEILRLYPPIYFFVNREAVENMQYDKIFIPKGMAIQVPVYLLHRDPDYWEQPEEFKPGRFAPENVGKNDPLAWQPFGAGPRNCVGMRFAQMEAKFVLTRILHKYRILPSEHTDKYPLELEPSPTIIRPKYGVSIRLQHC